MKIQGYFTRKGLELSAKLLAGSKLTITRVAAGSGNSGDPMAASSLAQPKQALAVNSPARKGSTVTISGILAAAQAEEAYALTELGIYARDPEEGEILYKLYRLAEPVDISPDSRLVLRFYLEETVSQDLDVTVDCSPAGLITETDFAPVRDKVLAGASENESVHLTAEELVPYIKSLPRMLNSRLRIYVSEGTVTETLTFDGFYGPGRIWITPAGASNDVILTGGAVVNGCKSEIVLDRLTFNGAISQEYFVRAYETTALTLIGCGIDGTGTSGKYGVRGDYGSNVIISSCELSNLKCAVLIMTSSMGSIINTTGSGNNVGIQIYWGGIALLCGSTPSLLGGAMNEKGGGIIAKADGTLL